MSMSDKGNASAKGGSTKGGSGKPAKGKPAQPPSHGVQGSHDHAGDQPDVTRKDIKIMDAIWDQIGRETAPGTDAGPADD